MTTDADNFLSTPFSRRQLLKGGAGAAAGAALAAYLPSSVRKAIAGANPAGFDLSQVKHIVLLMQENRSFDHYFGTLSGVRGFGDPRAMRLPNGRSVFAQPDPDNPDSYLLPYHLDTSNSSAQAVPSLSHAWQVQHSAWANGEMDGWLRSHIAADSDTNGPFTMGYYTADDIPFQYALANAFTICDNYFCSILGPTHPNRYMWMTGTVDPNGLAGGPALDNNAPNGTYSWTTMAERLESAGISWKCYQQADNYGTNVLEFFSQFINAPASSSLYQNAFGVSTLMNGQPASDPTMAFEEDCANGTLPTVSWIFPTSVASEHPSYLPAAGAQFVASKIESAGRQRGPVELDRLHPELRRERRLLRPRAAPHAPEGHGGRVHHAQLAGRHAGRRAQPRLGLPGAGHRGVALDRRRLCLLHAPRPHVGAALRRARHGHHRAQHQRLAAQHLRRLHDRLPAVARGGTVHPCRVGVGDGGAAGLPDPAVVAAAAGLPRLGPDAAGAAAGAAPERRLSGRRARARGGVVGLRR